MPTRRLIIEGRVQGVGFRAFVLRTALALEISGEVWNQRDAGVELVAEHPEKAVLDRFEAALKRGPGRVDSIQAESIDMRGYQGFQVADTR